MATLAEAVTPESEAQLAVDRGDRQRAIDILMRAYGRAIYGYCKRMVRDPDLADDVLQTTFLQAYDGLARFAGRSSLRTWLFGIAHHRCLDALKARRRWWQRAAPLDETVEPESAAEGPRDRVLSAERRSALDSCLGRLPEHARAAILLRFHEGYSYAEMAELCRERAATLQARVVRALPALRRCVEGKGIAP